RSSDEGCGQGPFANRAAKSHTRQCMDCSSPFYQAALRSSPHESYTRQCVDGSSPFYSESRTKLLNPHTAVCGIRRVLRVGAVCRKDLNHPHTAVCGIRRVLRVGAAW